MNTKRILSFLPMAALGSVAVAKTIAPSDAVVTAPADEQKRPNIIVLFTDDHRYDAIRAHGNKDMVTPNFDYLVKTGTSFNRAYLQGANSGATSSPSRAQLLTGRGVFEIPHGNGSPWPASMVTFPTAFQQAGYYTWMTGKSHNGPEASIRGFMGGARLYGLGHGFYKPHFRLAYQDFRSEESYGRQHMYFIGGENHEAKLTPAESSEYIGPHSSEIFGRAAVQFIEGYNRKSPFLMYVAMHAPHDARNAPQEYHDMFPPEKTHIPENFQEMPSFDIGDTFVRDERLAPFPRTVADTKKQWSDYCAIISHMDVQIGLIFDALRAKGMMDNTIIVWSSDSGLGMGSHGLFGKQNVYDDAGIHVPMVWNGPGIPKGETRTDLCYTYDIFPTLCDLTGVEVPSSVTGQSLAKSIPSELPKAEQNRQELFFGYKEFMRSVRDDRYKLIEYCVHGERHTELFDMQNDPTEMKNLADNATYSDILAKLRTRLKAHQKDEADWGGSFWKTYLNK